MACRYNISFHEPSGGIFCEVYIYLNSKNVFAGFAAAFHWVNCGMTKEKTCIHNGHICRHSSKQQFQKGSEKLLNLVATMICPCVSQISNGPDTITAQDYRTLALLIPQDPQSPLVPCLYMAPPCFHVFSSSCLVVPPCSASSLAAPKFSITCVETIEYCWIKLVD